MPIDPWAGINWDPTGLKFNIFSTDELKRISVLKIVTPRSFNDFGAAIHGGLHDPSLGPTLDHDFCFTCSKDYAQCAGHFGHIEISVPVFNPFFSRAVYNILRISCMSCYRLQVTDSMKELLSLQLKLSDAGYMVEAEELEIYKTKQGVTDKAPLEVSRYTEMLLREPYNKLSDTKNSNAIRTAIVNHTLRECIQPKCIHCKELFKKVRVSEGRLVIVMTMSDMHAYYENRGIEKPSDDDLKATKTVLIAQVCKEFLRKLYECEKELLPLLFPILHNTNQEHPTDLFFMDTIPVTPSQMRPIRRTDDDNIVEHSQTILLRNIILSNITVRAVLSTQKPNSTDSHLSEELKKIYNDAPGTTDTEKFYLAFIALQNNVNELLDYNEKSRKANPNGQGLKQLLEKKEGLVRMHMMGKRVNHAARTVITPDPNIGVDEIGIPKMFAMKLTYPTPVTPWNVSELRKMVLNGPNVYPGATKIEDSNGRCSKIHDDNLTQRQSMAKLLLTPHSNNPQGFKIVYRHLINGDILLLNRQPTLHRPSIMAHRAKILTGDKIFRLHYSNCKSYNADFDGDEMNAHFPQNEVARSEAINLVAVPHQYLVPKDGTPLGGLIQDHIVSAVKLFIRGKFFNREDYQQLAFQALHEQKGNLVFLPPTILKPVPLWSGKQIISTIIMNITPKGMPHINMIGTAKLSNRLWQITTSRQWNAGGTPLFGNNMSETEVFIRNGELLVGILDKNHFGATPYGLIHCMYELYGGRCSTTLLSALSRLFTYYLQWEGFTLGVKDILVQGESDAKRSAIIAECRKIGHETTAAALDLPPTVSPSELNEKVAQAYAHDAKFRSTLDRKFKTALDNFTNQINQACIPDGLISKFPQNNLQLMVQSGAKGSTVNTMQISALLGQIELEGKRPPLMMSGKSLPSFASFETSPKSGGFIDGRFMTGIQPQDFFFHCMAGREGLIDTAVKTSRSGYLQRCLVKHLEGLNVQYDMTVRDSDNSIVQFMYGEDGLDILKSQFIENSKQMQFLDLNRDAIVQEKTRKKQLNDIELTEQLKAHVKKMKQWRKKHGATQQKRRVSGFAQFSADMAEKIRSSIRDADTHRSKNGRTKLAAKTIKKWQKAGPDVREKYMNKICAPCPDPTVSLFRPDSCFDVLNEHLDEIVKVYRKSGQPIHDMDELMKSKQGAALISPGEPVGVLAAQSIGEPSTQMTLNTFHFAGRGEMNVTLGIPRLREILMLGSQTIKTPSMEIPLLPQKSAKVQAKIAEKLRKTLNRVTVADVLENIQVKSSLTLTPMRGIKYVVRFNFLPQDAYSDNYRVQPQEILRYMTRYFFNYMFQSISKSAKRKNLLIVTEDEKKERKQQEKEDAEADMQEPIANTFIKEENDESSDEDDDRIGDDDDATESKMKNKKSDEVTYDIDDEEDHNTSDDSGHESEEEQPPVAEQDEANEANEVNEANAAIQAEQAIDVPVLGHLDETRECRVVKEKNECISDYTFDTEEFRWCQVVFRMPTRIRDVDFTKIFHEIAGKCIIWEVPHIRRAITYTQNNQLYVKTDGINIHALTKFKDVLDLNRLYSNDIHAFARMYGIEAAARVIVREIQNVFDVYGIKINPRHLLLVADYMTASGKYEAMNRKCMESSVSPLQQMSFESSLRFMKLATLKGNGDQLNSPSSRLIVGQPCKIGTGAFTLYSSYLKDTEGT